MKVFPAHNTGRVNNLESTNFRHTFFEETSSTSGQVTKPTGSTIILDAWSEDVDALVLVIVSAGQQPQLAVPRDSSNNKITTTFDAAGNYSLSGTPYDRDNSVAFTQWAIAYNVDIPLLNFKNVDRTKLLT